MSYIASILNTDKTVLSVSQIVKVCAYRGWAVQRLLLLHGCEQQDGQGVYTQHGCHRSVKLQFTELGLWPGAESFLNLFIWVAHAAMSISERTLDLLLNHLREVH